MEVIPELEELIKNHKPKIRYWTEEDVKALIKYFHLVDVRELAKFFGRSVQAVQCKAHVLGLTGARND